MRLVAKHSLISKGGLAGNSLRSKPPVGLTAADADFLLEVLDMALAAVGTTHFARCNAPFVRGNADFFNDLGQKSPFSTPTSPLAANSQRKNYRFYFRDKDLECDASNFTFEHRNASMCC